jgi:hypothetical protein
MVIPSSELPDIDQIAVWASENLPPHYELLDVRCDFGSDMPKIVPEEFEIVIEYVNKLDPVMAGSKDAIRAHHKWSELLLSRVRAEWPPFTIRIAFKERPRNLGDEEIRVHP